MPLPENSIIRVVNSKGTAIGAGFLITDHHAITCAHVVATDLGLQSSSIVAPQEQINFDFPLVAAGRVLGARVIAWHIEIDVAVLEITDNLPADVQTARLGQSPDLWQHAFRAFGFPKDFPNGVWTSGRILGREATGWYQIEDSRQTGYFIQPGFSGGAIWDES